MSTGKKFSLPEAEFLKKSFNTCNSFDSITTKNKSISTNPAQSTNVEVLAKYVDLISKESSEEKIDSHKVLSVSIADKNVVHVTKNKNYVAVKADDLPSKEKTTMSITYQTRDKAYGKQRTDTIKIPIIIKKLCSSTEEKTRVRRFECVERSMGKEYSSCSWGHAHNKRYTNEF